METLAVSAPVVRVQDYILNTDVDKPRNVEYEVVLQNNTDFVVARKTKRNVRELVILISQNLFYFRDRNSGAIDTLSHQSIKNYLRDMGDGIELKEVHWLKRLDKNAADRINTVITDDVLVDMCRHNVLDIQNDLPAHRAYWLENSKLYMQLHKVFPRMDDNAKYKPGIAIAYAIHSQYGYNEAMYFANQLVQSGIQSIMGENYSRYHRSTTVMDVIGETTYNLQLRRFIDYLLFDLYGQGITNIGDQLLREYKDYLEMQFSYYGKIVEKYPKYFKTMHDVLTLKFNNLKYAKECENFELRAAEVEDLAYEGRVYSIIIPKTPQDLVDEGIALSHCVKDYISRVAEGECHILFLRYSATPNESLVTLQLSGDCICQAQGESRRHITEEEERFLQRWARENKLRVTVNR